MPARIVSHCGADHARGHAPLAETARDDGGVVEHEFLDFLHHRARVVTRETIHGHDGDGS
jgi:hypothetical protein